MNAPLVARAVDARPCVTTLLGDALVTLPTLAPASVHAIVTSPPYLDARDYKVPPTAWPEVTYRPRFDLEPVTVPAMTCCLGHESTLAAYVGHLVLIARELARVLRRDGTFWLNLAAGYSSGTTAPRKATTTEGDHVPASWKGRCHGARVTAGLAAKQRIPAPSAVCDALQADGWFVRADIVWAKPNPVPSSVADRPTPAHEHLFLLTRSPRYYFDALAIATPAKERASGNSTRRDGSHRMARGSHRGASVPWEGDAAHPRDVWTIPVGRFGGAHFATMPVELALRAIKAGVSAMGCCPTCGEPWWPVVVQASEVATGGARRKVTQVYERQGKGGALATGVHHTRARVAWELPCACPYTAPVPCTVLDPFGGAATTAVAAREVGAHAVLCELSPAFVEMQAERLAEAPAPRRGRAPKPAAAAPVARLSVDGPLLAARGAR